MFGKPIDEVFVEQEVGEAPPRQLWILKTSCERYGKV